MRRPCVLRLRLPQLMLLLACCGIAGGCTKQEITFHGISYNKAQSDFGNREILLNAVRASKRYPMYFSSLGSVNAIPHVTGSVSGMFNFNRAGILGYSISPRAAYTGGFSSLQISGFETEEFIRAIQDPVDLDIIKGYIDKGWPRRVVLMLFLDQIRITRKNHDLIVDNFFRFCDSPKADAGSGEKMCSLVRETYSRGCQRPRLKTISDVKEKGGREVRSLDRYYQYDNYPRNECGYRLFRDFVMMLAVAEVRLAYKTKTVLITDKVTTTESKGSVTTTKSKSYKPSSSPRVVVTINRNGVETVEYIDVGLSQRAAVHSFRVRSVQGMIFYIGELIAAQLRDENSYVPEVVSGGKIEPLFLVDTGILPQVRAAVSIEHEHTRYAIPRTDYGVGHRSLQVLALVRQVLGLKKKKEDLPSPANILIGG